MQKDQVDLTALAATYIYTINHIRTETKSVKEVGDQSVELAGLTRDCDLGGVDGHGRFDIAAIGDMLGPKVDRHVHSWDKHVHHISDHSPNNERINGGSHEGGRKEERLKRKKQLKSAKQDLLWCAEGRGG